MNVLDIWQNPVADHESQLLVNHCSIPVYKIRNVITPCFLWKIKLLQWALDDVIKVTQWEIQLFSLYCLESVDNSQWWTKESQWITRVSKVSAKLPSVLDFFFITEIHCQLTLKFRVLTNAFLLTRSPLFFFFLLGRSRAETGKQSSWHPWRLFVEWEGSYHFRTATSSSWGWKVTEPSTWRVFLWPLVPLGKWRQHLMHWNMETSRCSILLIFLPLLLPIHSWHCCPSQEHLEGNYCHGFAPGSSKRSGPHSTANCLMDCHREFVLELNSSSKHCLMVTKKI